MRTGDAREGQKAIAVKTPARFPRLFWTIPLPGAARPPAPGSGRPYRSFCAVLLLLACAGCLSSGGGAIDREALVRRHIPRLSEADPLSPFSVGNGKFAFTADVTGLQTFPEFYEKGIPLATQSEWGWHTIPGPGGTTLEDASEYWDVDGRRVPYASRQNTAAGQWLRANPHRLHLGRIGFEFSDTSGRAVGIGELEGIRQSADIWRGVLESSFAIRGVPVEVETACHPEIDQVSARIRSQLLGTGAIGVRLEFPYGSTRWGKDPGDWSSPERHRSEIVARTGRSVRIRRTLDADRYHVSIEWDGDAEVTQVARHSFLLAPRDPGQFGFSVRFSASDAAGRGASVRETVQSAERHWRRFWQSGGAIDLSRSTDSRAGELERRIVLSRYLTAIQCAGSFPPAETGLTCNSWYGKSHLEMHWWHGVHFALWGNPQVLENTLPWYRSVLPLAAETARRQGYAGVRWPKMVAPDGREGPSSVGVFLVWQQPHPIYYAELLYRLTGDEAVLGRYRDIVFPTADFMASYARWDRARGLYVLGPPLIPAQEIYRPGTTSNPTFELAYWKFGLETAQLWRERLGLGRVPQWDHVLDHLPPLPENNGLYQNAEIAPDTFEDAFHRRDHPTLVAAFGMLGDARVDRRRMRATLEKVLESWDWPSTWGWDYPMVAMTAARVGRPDLAIEALCLDTPKNRYLPNGHNYQREDLPLYLPGNGGLLAAAAMMAAGWEGAPPADAPGFPKDGSWTVRHEGLRPMP